MLVSDAVVCWQKNLLCPSSFNSYKSIVEFIDAQFEAYLQEELKIKRTLHSYHDTRIHACLYFIAPTGHSLKSLDLVTMKKLDSKVSFTSLSVIFSCFCVKESTRRCLGLFLLCDSCAAAEWSYRISVYWVACRRYAVGMCFDTAWLCHWICLLQS